MENELTELRARITELERRLDESTAVQAAMLSLINLAVYQPLQDHENVAWLEQAFEVAHSQLLASESSDTKLQAFSAFTENYLAPIAGTGISK